MSSRLNILSGLWALICLCAVPLGAGAQVQEDLNLMLERSVFLKETISESSQMAPFLDFPYIGLIPKFEDKSYPKRIAQAEKEEDLFALDSLLTNYIRRWGVENFHDGLQYLWKAGQVKELLGDSSSSALYYELGLKNQRPWRPQVKIHFDSLRARHNVEWVDLQFYYKILEARRKIDPLIPPKGVMLNMGPKINSGLPDYAPFMHPSDSVLIFTSRRDEEIVIDDLAGRKNEDLYFCQRDFIGGAWTYAERFSKEINSDYNEGSACLSPDGKHLYFTRCDDPDGLGSCDIYMADWVGSTWQNIRNLGPLVNSNAWDSHPNVTPDGKTLFFSSNRKGGFGKSDIFVTLRLDDGTWTPARNMGPIVNTVLDEVTPFFHEVNNTLYFSSTGHLKNMGGYDIYKSRWLDSHWESPKNVGPLVNSSGNEYYFSIDGRGTRLFYASAKKDQQKAEVKQNFDLYSFPMPMEARPDAIVTLKGYLIDSASGKPITGIVLVIDKEEGIEVAPKHINPYGYFEFDLINNKQYEVYIQGENFLSIKEDLTMLGDTNFTVFANSFESGKPLVFENLQFGDDSYALDASIEPKLDYLVRFLQKYPMFRMEIKGHTDADGEPKYNLELSRKRAHVIRKYILKKGQLKDEMVRAKGFGETRPLVPNDSEENKRTNRRVEFEVWLDPNYRGPMVLPTADDFFMQEQEEEMFDPEFMEEMDWDWEEEFENDWDWETLEDDDWLEDWGTPDLDDLEDFR